MTTDQQMYMCIVILLICLSLGLSATWYNLNDEEGRQRRIEARRAQRKKRKKF